MVEAKERYGGACATDSLHATAHIGIGGESRDATQDCKRAPRAITALGPRARALGAGGAILATVFSILTCCMYVR